MPRRRLADFVGVLDGVDGHWPQYRETLPDGKSYAILDKQRDGPLDNTGVFVVPANHYFMTGDMGRTDRRTGSGNSRYNGQPLTTRRGAYGCFPALLDKFPVRTKQFPDKFCRELP